MQKCVSAIHKTLLGYMHKIDEDVCNAESM